MSIRRKTGIVYKAINNINKKIYIGQTWGYLSSRISKHVHSSGCVYFHNALLKYGLKNFTWEILFESDNQENLDLEETRLIDHFKSNDKNFGYNLRAGGSCGKFNEKSKEKMRLSALNYFKTEEARHKQGKIQRKRYSNFEERIKHSRAHGGKPFYARKEDNLHFFQTQVEAAQFIKCDQRRISSALKGRAKEINGWIFSYNKIEEYFHPSLIKKQNLIESRRVLLNTINLKEKGWIKKLALVWKVCESQAWNFLKNNFQTEFNTAIREIRPRKNFSQMVLGV
jgi:group I intron endonuclease